MSLTIRPATADDCAEMATLLNEIIEIGGPTAHTTPVDADTLIGWMGKWAGRNAWHVACDADGRIMGFQFIEPNPKLPSCTADIATFARVGATGQGIGQKLFIATRAAAKGLGYTSITAVIRADNTGGLAYYTKMGFTDHDVDRAVALKDGTPVDRILKRLAL